MARYKIVLEVEDADGYTEDMVIRAIGKGLRSLGVNVIRHEPFERIGEKEEALLKELQQYAENNYGSIEVTFDKGTYYLLHICKNNVPVPLYQTEDIYELAEYLYENY